MANTVVGYPAHTLKIYKDRKGEWRWTVFARNGRKIANAGEGYKRRMKCVRIVSKMFPTLDVPPPPVKKVSRTR